MKFTVKQNFYILIVLTMVVFIIIGIFTVNSFNKIEELHYNRNMAMELQIHTLSLRKHEKDFLKREIINKNFFETKESKYITKFNSDLKDAILHIDSIKQGRIYIDAGVVSEINKIETNFQKYDEIFEELINHHFEKGFKDYGLIGKMRKAIHDLDDVATEYNLNTILEFIYLIYVSMKKTIFLEKILLIKTSLLTK